MGKFIDPKFSSHHRRVVKKRIAKPLAKCTADKQTSKPKNKPKKIRKEKNVGIEEPKSPGTELIVRRSTEEEVEYLHSELQDLRVEVTTNPSSGKKYLKLIKPDSDLFAYDDLKARHDQYTTFNFIFIILDEISLEGLEGITIEALWKRIQKALKLEKLPDYLKDVIWEVVCLNSKIKFFQLPEAREELILCTKVTCSKTNLFANVCDTGLDIYKVEQASKGSGHYGSCSTLLTRTDISEQVREMSLDQASATYKNTLVLLADEDLRKNALFDDLMDPNYEFTMLEYCLLERIGRARETGQSTLGPSALSSIFILDPRSVYHYCKRLRKECLISRQYCARYSVNMEHPKVGRLFHLRRFYQKRKSKYLLMLESVIDYLRKFPGYRAPYASVRALFEDNVCGKFFKHPDFLKYVDTNIYMPYREFYPEAPFSEYMTKSLSNERIIQLMQLKDPFVNIAACWGDGHPTDLSDDEDDDEDNVPNRGRRIYNKDFIREVYQFILSKRLDGAKTTELSETFDIDFPSLRCVLKKLTFRQLVLPKKRDVGRQTVHQYVATCLLQNPDFEIVQPKPVQPGSSRALEKLKQRQKQKTDSLPKERVYTAEQFEVDREHRLLSLDTNQRPSVTIEIPQIMCDYFIAEPITPQCIREINIFLVKLQKALEPFKLNLTLPKIRDDATPNLRNVLAEEDNRIAVVQGVFKDHFGELWTGNFKPDYFSKAFLMQAFLDDVNINKKEIIDFLDPNITSRKADKRSIQTEMKTNNKIVNIDPGARPVAGIHMGANPMVVLSEEDEESGFVMQVLVSTPIGDYKTGDITQYVYDPSIETTERVLSRILFILRTIQQQEVFEEMNRFLKLIFNEESEAGYNKRIDRKSLHRIYRRLTGEGYIKIFSVTVSKGESRKIQTYVCHPEVTVTHHILQESWCQLKEKLYCYVSKNTETIMLEPVPKKVAPPPEKSPFIEDDVLKSINEIRELTTKNIKAKSCKKSGKFYGQRPKFARLTLMHELLFYLIYELDKDTQPLSESEVAQMFQKHQITLTQADLKNLPPVYRKEISWKTFIPPLPRHDGWEDGWALLIDIILRFPITLMTRCHAVNFVSSELQEVLQHPIKRFYLLRNVSSNIRMIVMYRRKFIHNAYSHLVLLAYCGLIQFGPSSYHDREKSFFYLNRKATLWDTISSTPGYQKIEKKEYPQLSFYFTCMDDVSKYWSTMNNICINTCLTTKLLAEGKTITLIDSSVNPGLSKAVAAKTKSAVKQLDVGELPGDHQGAAGLDSSMWAHVQKNWYYFAMKNGPNIPESIDSLILDKVVNNKVCFDQLKLPVVSNKYYIGKPHDPRNSVPTRKFRQLKPGKKMPVIKRTVPLIKRKPPDQKKIGLDAVDKATMRKLGTLRYRPSWSEEEDKLLILLKIASNFITPGTTIQIISYATLRDVLHVAMPKAQDKTSRSVANRLRVLVKSVPILTNIENHITNLYKLVPIAKYFVPFRNFVLNGQDSVAFKRKYKLSDKELQNAFIFLAHYFFRHRREVEVSLHGKNTSTDYFNKENLDFFMQAIEPFEITERFYLEPQNLADIRKYTLKNTIQSALSHKKDQPVWSLQMYKIYQQFSEAVLRTVLHEMKNQRMIQSKKDPTKTFFSPYRLSVYYIYSQTGTFWFHTMEEAYKAFLDLKYSPIEMDYSFEAMEEKKYGQMFGINEVLSFMHTETTIDFKIPEHHLILNASVEDHSEVIEELAKRYQAKLRSDQKDADQQTELQTSSKPDEEDAEMSVLEPGPSSVEVEQPGIEFILFDDDVPLDLSVAAKNSSTIDSLKHWISDCMDTNRVRSPSPELLNLEVSQAQGGSEIVIEDNEPAPCKNKEDKMLTLEEIKEEMLKPYDAEETRLVPYISDLTKLLIVSFEDIDSDERAYYLMKKHFVQQYPSLEKITVPGLDSHYLSEFLENRTSITKIWERVERDAYVDLPSDNGAAFENILEKGGCPEDASLALEMLNYIRGKEIYGAAGHELKDKFSGCQGNCSLEFILLILMEHHIVLRAGVCTVTFVHSKYRDPWLTDTFMLTPEQVSLFPNSSSGEDLLKLEADIKGIDITKWIKIKPLPWVVVDGTLNKNMLKMWLSHVFSYCIENPKICMKALCDKFCYLKPVDVFYLVEILEQVGALEIRRCTIKTIDIFSEFESDDCKGTMLDKFEEIYIELNNICFTALGSFFHTL